MKLDGHIKPKGDDEKLLAMKPHLQLKRFSPTAKFYSKCFLSRSVLNPPSYQGFLEITINKIVHFNNSMYMAHP